jgi:hypothetical protein
VLIIAIACSESPARRSLMGDDRLPPSHSAVYFLFPETKGRMLEEISEIFDGPSDHSVNASAQEALEHDDKIGGEKKTATGHLEYAA